MIHSRAGIMQFTLLIITATHFIHPSRYPGVCEKL
jgi:hypothetical protein